jgi:proteasome lid subunit RPN8/RPN11
MKKKKKSDPFNSPVLLTLKAYERIVGYAIRYANEKINENKWREVYGILIGSIENDSKLIVKDAIPMIVGDRAGVKYENKQYVDMAQIDASIYERAVQDDKNDFIIGWWHTHPGFSRNGFFFSPIDCMTQLGYQIPNPYAVGLVFDHCEMNSNSNLLGIAGIRLKDPERGISSTYDLISLDFEFDEEEMLKESEIVIKNVYKNIEDVLKEVNYIDETLRKKALAQLQRNYGLIMVPKEDVKVTEDEEEAQEDERYLYEWDPEFFKKSYRIPKFREKIEKLISEAHDELDKFDKKEDTEKYESKRFKLTKKIQNLLKKPNDWYDKLMEDFSKKIEIISDFFTYLDTSERKIIEYFEERSSDYYKVLDDLNRRMELKLEDF